MRFLRYIRAYWREPAHPTAYERGRIDALNAMVALLNDQAASLPRVQREVEERLKMMERSE